MFVMKFGGTSVTKPESVAAISKLVSARLSEQPVVVVSALSGITDLLVKLSHSAAGEVRDNLFTEINQKHDMWIDAIFGSNKTAYDEAHKTVDNYLSELAQLINDSSLISQLELHDSVVAFGEKISSALISYYLIQNGIQTQQLIATNCIITTNQFGGADFMDAATRKASKASILPLVKQGVVPVITGFIGANRAGQTTILGRGGSDYSAAIIGYAIQASEIQIWTDVNGVYSADPRVIKTAKLVKKLSYQEAAELAMFGAKVLHPRTIQPAVKLSIPVKVLNTFNLDNIGTIIEHAPDNTDGTIKSITWRKSAPLLNIYSANMFLSKGFLQKVFAILAKHDISVNLLSASEVSVSVTLDNIGKLNTALAELNKFAKTDYFEGFGTISLVGDSIMATPSLMQKVFNIFQAAKIRVQMLSYSASNINISLLVASDRIDEIVPVLHKEFIE